MDTYPTHIHSVIKTSSISDTAIFPSLLLLYLEPTTITCVSIRKNKSSKKTTKNNCKGEKHDRVS